MATNPRAEPTDSTASRWPDVEAVLDNLAELARVCDSTQEFCVELVSGAVASAGAAGGRVWLEDGDGWRLQAAVGDDRSETPPPWIARVADTQQTSFGAGDEASSGRLGAAIPIRLDEHAVAILEVDSGERDHASLRQALATLLEAFAEVAVSFFEQRERRRLLQSASVWNRRERFIEECHRPWAWRETAYALANEAAALLQCDRATVLRRRGWRCFSVESVSGVDTIDRRSNQIRSLERMAKDAATWREAIWYGIAEAAPETAGLFEPHVDLTHYRTVGILPLDDHARRSELMLIVEFVVTPRDETSLLEQTECVVQHGGSAAQRALRLDKMPLRRLSHALEFAGLSGVGGFLKLAFPIALLVGLLIAACTVQTDLEVSARGELQPVVQRRVFAPADGSVADIRVQRGDRVQTGDLLITMSDRELDFTETELAGRIQTVSAQLRTTRTERLQGAKTPDAPNREQELAVREEQLVQQLANLNKQREILQRQRKDLQVRSPIAGQVVSRDIRHDLATRPVKRGQELMVVAATGGDWELRLSVPENRIRHVLDAADASREPLEVRFMLASEAGRTYVGKVKRIAMAAESDEQREPTIRINVSLNPDSAPKRHVGADVAARIVCGRSSIAYAWLHEAYERFRLQFFL